jgi:putative peptidoglycan lipid II flippase
MPGSSRFVASARINSLLTLVSRVLGLAREVVFSYFFSTGELLSAFRVAFIIPNLARRLFGEGALSAAVVPVLTQTLHESGEERSRRLVGSLTLAMSLLLVGVVLLGEAVLLVARSYSDDPALRLTAITLPYMPLICATALLGSVLNVRDRFAAAAAAPVLFNVIVVGVTLFAALALSLESQSLMDVLCLSVVAGGGAQLLLVGYDLARARFSPRWRLDVTDAQIHRVVRLMAPMFLGLSAVQINTLCDSMIAYLFIVVNGQRIGPAVLGYAQFLYQFPLGVFGIGLATALFPHLSAKAAEGDRAGLAAAFQRGMRLCLFLALPASVGLIVTAQPLVAALYERGAFTPQDTRRVAGALIFYSLGMGAYFAQHIVVRTFYAHSDSRTPTRAALTMVTVNLVLNLALVGWLQERGLALATAICAVVQVLWLCLRLRVTVPEIHWKPIVQSGLRSGTACLAMAVVLLAIQLGPVASWAIGERPILHLLILVVPGAATYAAAARWGRLEELDWILHRSAPEKAIGVSIEAEA